MRLKGLTAILGVAVAGAVLFLWVRRSEPPEQSTRLLQQASGAAPSDGSNATNETTQGISVATTNRSKSADGVSVDALLASITDDPLPKDIPTLTPTVEADIIRRYQQAETLDERSMLILILALGGGENSFQLMTNIVLSEFRGRVVDIRTNSWLLGIPFKIGLLARQNDHAYQFLMAGIRKELPFEQSLWKAPYPPSESLLRGRCWSALGLSGRPEFRSLLQEVLNGQHRDYTRGLESAVVDAAYYAYRVNELGVDEFLAKFGRLGKRVNDHGSWKDGTDNGKAWFQWKIANSPVFRRPSASTNATP